MRQACLAEQHAQNQPLNLHGWLSGSGIHFEVNISERRIRAHSGGQRGPASRERKKKMSTRTTQPCAPSLAEYKSKTRQVVMLAHQEHTRKGHVPQTVPHPYVKDEGYIARKHDINMRMHTRMAQGAATRGASALREQYRRLRSSGLRRYDAITSR